MSGRGMMGNLLLRVNLLKLELFEFESEPLCLRILTHFSSLIWPVNLVRFSKMLFSHRVCITLVSIIPLKNLSFIISFPPNNPRMH